MNKQQLDQLRHFSHRFGNEKPLYILHMQHPLAPYEYGNAISDFIEYMYEQQLVPANYQLIAESWQEAPDKKQFIAGLNKEQCLQVLGGFIRNDRFSEGLLASHIENGNVEAVINRLQHVI